MRRTMLALLCAAIALTSCNWELSDDDADLDDVKITTQTETTETVEKVSTFKNDILSCYVVRYVSDPATRTVDQEQYYNADGILQYSWKYGRNGAGLVTTAAKYGPLNEPSYYYAYAYGSDDTITTQAEYGSSGSLNWLRRYETNASGGIMAAASYNGSVVLIGALKYFYIDETKDWNMEIAYGQDSGSLAGKVKVESPCAGEVNLESLQAEEKQSLSLPAVGSLPEPVIGDPATLGLTVSGYRFSLDDDHGNTVVSLDENFYPTSGTRSDDRIDEAVRVDLSYDDNNRIAVKETYYGNILALRIAVEYSGDTLYPTRVETSGKSMLMPLDYEIVYGNNREIDSVRVYSGDTLVRRFKYEYVTPVTGTLTAREVRGMDPFAFLSDMLRAGATIYEYDGDGELVETFTATSNVSGVSVEVRLPTESGGSGGAVNGSFQITYDGEGNCSSISAKDTSGNVVWQEEISLFTDMWDDLETRATTAFDETVDYGSMVETMIQNDIPSAIAKVQENFVYNLLF